MADNRKWIIVKDFGEGLTSMYLRDGDQSRFWTKDIAKAARMSTDDAHATMKSLSGQEYNNEYQVITEAEAFVIEVLES